MMVTAAGTSARTSVSAEAVTTTSSRKTGTGTGAGPWATTGHPPPRIPAVRISRIRRIVLLLSQKATPHVRRDGAQEHGRNPSKPSPAPRGRRWTARQVSWLPDLPTPGPSHAGNPLPWNQLEDPP